MSVFRCGTCRRKYANPFTHTCVVRLDRRTPPGRTRLAVGVKVTRTCPTCHQPRNPLDFTHTCTVKTDFKQRRRKDDRDKERARKKRARDEKRERAKARKAARPKRRRSRPAPARQQARPAPRPAPKPRERHDYLACNDPDCSVYPCRVYREGLANGQIIGYAEGYPAGIADCPRPHTG